MTAVVYGGYAYRRLRCGQQLQSSLARPSVRRGWDGWGPGGESAKSLQPVACLLGRACSAAFHRYPQVRKPRQHARAGCGIFYSNSKLGPSAGSAHRWRDWLRTDERPVLNDLVFPAGGSSELCGKNDSLSAMPSDLVRVKVHRWQGNPLLELRNDVS